MTSTDGTPNAVPLNRHRTPWPVHPQPHEDETMTSWLVRTAAALGTPFQDLCAAAWQGRKVQQTFLNRCPSDAIVSSLVAMTGCCVEQIRATTLGTLEGVIFQGPLESRTQWVLPRSEGKELRGNQQFCPECLAEDAKPHYRLTWQLAFVTGCPWHEHRPILDACPFCSRALDPAHNHAPKVRNEPDLPITKCRYCKLDLRDAIGFGSFLKPFLPHKVDRMGQVLQARMLDAIKEGWMEIGGMESVHSCLAFDGIYQIVKALLAKRSATRLWMAIGRRLALDGERLYKAVGANGKCFETLGVGQRHHLMAGAAWLLEDWPDRFVSICQEAKVWSNHLKQDRRDRTPFWLDKVIDEHLKIQHAQWRDPAVKGQKRAVDSYTRLGRLVLSTRLVDRARKIEFIRAHLELAGDIKGLALAMQDAGLYSKGSQPSSIIKLMPKLIAAADGPDDPTMVQGKPLAMKVRKEGHPFPRGRAYMTIEEEDKFMASFREGALLGIPITAKAVRESMSEFLRKPVTEGAIYRFLKRKNWVAPRSPKRKATVEAT